MTYKASRLRHVLLVALCSVLATTWYAPGIASASELQQIQQQKGPSDWTDAQLQAFAESIHKGTTNSAYTQFVFYELSPSQRDVVTRRISDLVGVSFQDLKSELAKNSSLVQDAPMVQGSGRPEGAPGFSTMAAWNQNVMPLPNFNDINPYVGMAAYTWAPTCDSDPSDGDFRFDVYTSQVVVPSRLGWFTYVPLVTWALNYAYPGGLSSWGLSYEIHVCLGDRGTNLAGGPVTVRDALKYRYR